MKNSQIKIQTKSIISGKTGEALLISLGIIFSVAVFSALSHIIYSLNLPVYVSIPLAVLTVFLQWLTYCALRSGRCAWFKFYNRNNKKGRVLFWFKPKYSAKSMRFYLSLFLRKSGWTFLLLLPGVFTATSFVLLAADGGIELNLFLCGIIGGGVMLILGMAFRFLIIQKYFLAQYLFVSDPKIKVRDALRQSTALMNGKLKKTALFKLSFIPWFILCIGILPSVYVQPYYRQSCVMYADNCIKN